MKTPPLKPHPTCLNIYSIRKQLTSPENTRSALRQLAAGGFSSIEYWLHDTMPAAPEIKSLCEEYGLSICGLHDLSVLDAPAASLQVAELLNSPFITYSFPAGRDLTALAGVQQLIRDLNRAGDLLRREGRQLTYHNHGLEFFDIGGKTVLEWLVEGTDPELVGFELDIYWVQFSNHSPEAWCKKLGARLAQLHLKDGKLSTDGTPRSCEPGTGIIDLGSVLRAAPHAARIIEQDVYDDDPFTELVCGAARLQQLDERLQRREP